MNARIAWVKARNQFALASALALSVAACRTLPPDPGDAYRAELSAWKARRVESLTGTNGWTTLVGLHWLAAGRNTIGASKANAVVLPGGRAPEFAGELVRDGRAVRFEAAFGVEARVDGLPSLSAELRSDASSSPSVLAIGGLRMTLIQRGERLGLRVRDERSPARLGFRGLKYFPIEPRWRLSGRFEASSPPRRLRVADVTGAVKDEASPGAIIFTMNGQEYRLDVVGEEPGAELFIVFRDATAEKTTYPAGRFLYVPRPDASGRVAIDFNRAYNPPCAFTEFATCPLPPPQNILPFPIEAGERRYAGGH